ncbi:Uncharacterised protein [Actinomyces bovis]|uniref:Uncharacterized protein n=1 Tax=Actinomyces bovis TaxID=1658 RepID=A0ABY1VLF6_9ACTO|nr:hypothetical protein [Actinomyces bovis]SPT52939.1 Uncharacterised protein [Actinomyces bovis]VEG55117.1 Uncharacterised protein [Actinomyces israelii]
MPVSLRDFMNAMTQWASDVASEEARAELPPSSWMKVRAAGTEVPGGTVFSPAVIVQMVLAGRIELYETVAAPLAQWLNQRFGPADSDGVAAQAGAQALPGQDPAITQQAAPEIAAAAASTDRPAVTGAPSVQSDADFSASTPAAGAASSAEPSTATVPPASAPASTAASSSSYPAPMEEPQETFQFPTYDFSRDDLDSAEAEGQHIPVTVERFEDRLRYTWPDPGEGEVYRVIVSDMEDPYSPDDFEEVAATRSTQAWDSTPTTTAVRFVTVWAYQCIGDSLGQCRRVASKVVVHDLQDWELNMEQETGSVVGSWVPPVAPAGLTAKVLAARLPLDQPPGRFIRNASWLSYEIPNNGSGFRDSEVVGGKKYNYVAAVEVTSNGQVHSSKPVLRSIVPEVVVERIADLTAVEVPDPDGLRPSTLTVSWSQDPNTKVALYRTQKPVSAEARSRDEIPVTSLADANLTEDSRISTKLAQLAEIPGSTRCQLTLTDVPWPDGEDWDAVYLTPVTLRSEDLAVIGTPLRLKRAGGVRNLTLVRRLSWDLVTFTWPGDAASVELRHTLPGQTMDPATPPVLTVDKELYRDRGGFVLSPALPPQGGALHLNSLTYLEGKQIPSPVASVVVPPRWVYAYQLDWPGEVFGLKGFGRAAAAVLRQTYVEVQVRALQGFTDPRGAVSMVLLHNPERLPLSPEDGEAVPLYTERPTKDGGQQTVILVALPGDQGAVNLWFDHAKLSPGYLRLMINSSSTSQINPEYGQLALEHYALVDPDLNSLTKRR